MADDLQGQLPLDATAKDHLLSLRAQGYTLAEIGRQVGRSPRALRFVLNGERDGAALVDSLAELDIDGKVTHQAPRPVTKDGRRVKVRAPGGRLVEPPAPAGAGVRRRRARSAQTAPQDVRHLIDAVRADGFSYNQIGALVGRSGDTIRKVHRGERSADTSELLRTPLTELYTTGVVTHQAPRGTTSTGRYRKVRGPGGTWIEPPAPRGTRPPVPREPRRTDHTIPTRPGGVPSTGATQPTFPQVPLPPPSTRRGRAPVDGPALQMNELPGGRRFYQGTVSRSGRKDRARMNAELIDVINAASNARRRMHFHVVVDGHPFPVQVGGKSGYDPAAVAAAIEANGGNTWSWLGTQVVDRYSIEPNATVTGIQLEIW